MVQWRYDTIGLTWTVSSSHSPSILILPAQWLSGTSSSAVVGVYGSLNVKNGATNYPGARWLAGLAVVRARVLACLLAQSCRN